MWKHKNSICGFDLLALCIFCTCVYLSQPVLVRKFYSAWWNSSTKPTFNLKKLLTFSELKPFSHPHIIVLSFQCPLPPSLHPFPSSTWHYERIQSLPVKFIRANSLCNANVNPHHLFAFVSLFSQDFSQSAPLKGSQTQPVNPSLSIELRKWLWCFWLRRFCPIPFHFGLLILFFVGLQSISQQNIRKSWVVRSRETVWTRLERGHDVWCVSAVKLLFPQ